MHVNSESYVPISNDCFEGQVRVRVKDFKGLAPEGKEAIAQSAYFEKAKDMTFSIETTGESQCYWLCMTTLRVNRDRT